MMENNDILSVLGVCLFVLRFYGPVNPMGSCRVCYLFFEWLVNTRCVLSLHAVSCFITKTHLFKNIENFTTKKKESFRIKKSVIFQISAENIDCGYSCRTASPRRF